MNIHGVFRSAFVLPLLALPAAAPTPALALDNGLGYTRCECGCDLPGGRSVLLTVANHGIGCAAFNNRPCNSENPNTGLIETGRIFQCWPDDDVTITDDPRFNGTFTTGGSTPVPQTALPQSGQGVNGQ
ncbi:MAG: hypothetical protein R3F55_05780 [Alphaproteobacteria bacterium]